MDNVLFISDLDIRDKTGATANGLMHYRLIKSIFQDNFYGLIVSDTDIDSEMDSNIFCIKKSNSCEKIESILTGYPGYLNKRARVSVFRLIQKNNIKIVYIDNSISGKFVKKLKSRFNNLTVICFFHDIEAILLRSQLKLSSLYRKINLLCMIKNEKYTVNNADKTVVLNKRDWDLYHKVYNKVPNHILPIVLKDKILYHDQNVHQRDMMLNILFVGADYYPNVNGIRWFIQHVMPKVKDKCVLKIVGSKMEKYSDDFKSQNVHVVGTVDDIELYYRDAQIIVIPIFEGGGMKVKTGEALNYGKVILGTAEALTGYWDDLPDCYKGRRVILCNSAQEYIQTINRLYSEYFECFDQNLAQWIHDFYSFTANLDRMKHIIFG